MANYVPPGWKRDLTPFHWLLLGGPDRVSGVGQMVRGHHQIPRSNDEEEKSRVDGHKGVDATPVYALHGKTI